MNDLTVRTSIRFRPLIGVNFCNLDTCEYPSVLENGVSVPLSGLTSVNKTTTISFEFDGEKFPSPYRG